MVPSWFTHSNWKVNDTYDMQNIRIQNSENTWHTLRILYLILLRLTLQLSKLLTYSLETRGLASRNSQSCKLVNCWLASRNSFVGLIQFDRPETCWLVTLHLLAFNVVILPASILIQSLINPIKVGLFKASIFLAGSLWYALYIPRRTILISI